MILASGWYWQVRWFNRLTERHWTKWNFSSALLVGRLFFKKTNTIIVLAFNCLLPVPRWSRKKSRTICLPKFTATSIKGNRRISKNNSLNSNCKSVATRNLSPWTKEKFVLTIKSFGCRNSFNTFLQEKYHRPFRSYWREILAGKLFLDLEMTSLSLGCWAIATSPSGKISKSCLKWFSLPTTLQ